MSATVRTIEPTVITTREELVWTKSYDDYPASLWTLQYRFRSPTGVGFNAAGVADGDSFTITVPGSTTDDLSAGRYDWQAWVTEIADATNKIKIGDGRVMVKLGFDPDVLASVDTRSAAKICLDVIDAAISGQMTESVQEYEFSTPAGTRRVKRMTPGDLMAARKYYAAIVADEARKERTRNGGSFGQSVGVRFFDD